MPTLNWIGKEAVVKHHKEVPFRLLEPVAELSCSPSAHPSTSSGRTEKMDAVRPELVEGQSENLIVRIAWNVVDPDLVRAINHDQLAGLQLADAVATSVFYAVHKNQYGEVEERYLKLIAPIIYRHEGRMEGYGLKFWCEDKTEILRVLETTRK